MKIKLINKLTDFGLGVLAGFIISAILFGVVCGVVVGVTGTLIIGR